MVALLAHVIEHGRFTRPLRAPKRAPMQRHNMHRAMTWNYASAQRWRRPVSPISQFGFVPYRGGAPIVQDLVAGQIDLTMMDPTTFLAHVRAGNLEAFAVAAAARLSSAPEIPTVDEAGLPDASMPCAGSPCGDAPTAIAITSSGTDWQGAGVTGRSPPPGSWRDAARSVQQRVTPSVDTLVSRSAGAAG
jgi:hypothetical protein